MVEPLLVVEGVRRSFGGFAALDGVDLELGVGEAIGLVGPNGSGKTTLINLISGVYAPTGGDISFAGKSVAGMRSHRLAQLGINRTFQVPKCFASLSAADNLRVAVLHGGRNREPTVDDIWELTRLKGLENRLASSLTAAQQKRLDLARALATGPRLLLVDELGAGLSPAELDEIASMLSILQERGIALLVVEHLLGFLRKVTDRVVVLNAGRKLFSGTLSSAVANPEVIRVFLGDSHGT